MREDGRLSEHHPLHHPQTESGRAVLHSQSLIRLRQAQFPLDKPELMGRFGRMEAPQLWSCSKLREFLIKEEHGSQ